MSVDTTPRTTDTTGARASWRHTALAIGGTVLVALAANLVLWVAGVALGGSFVTVDDGVTTDAAPGGVVIFTVLPLLIGLTATALLSRWRSFWNPVGQLVGAVLALATIAGTLVSSFDTPSTVALSLMHVVVAAAVVGGLRRIR